MTYYVLKPKTQLKVGFWKRVVWFESRWSSRKWSYLHFTPLCFISLATAARSDISTHQHFRRILIWRFICLGSSDLFGKHQAAISSSGLLPQVGGRGAKWFGAGYKELSELAFFFTNLWNALYSWYFARHCIALKMSISGADKSRIDFSLLLSQQLNF